MTARRRVGAPAVAAALGGLLLASCAVDFDADAIRGARTTEAPFPSMLGEKYLELAEAERAEQDWRDADVFAARAQAAFAGEPPPPEPPEDRDLPPEAAAEAATIRDAIQGYIADGALLFAAEATAEAQAAYDCWLQEAEEGHQQADIDACKARLDAALDALEANGARAIFVLLPDEDGRETAIRVANAEGETVLDQPGETATVGAGAPPKDVGVLDEKTVTTLFGAALAATPERPRRFVLYFVTGTTELTPESQATLPDVQKTAAERVAPRVDVVGHSDRVGAAPVNATLSRERAQSVADLLIAVGVPPADIRVDSFGEADNAVPTEDGVAEPLNRRVEIIVR